MTTNETAAAPRTASPAPGPVLAGAARGSGPGDARRLKVLHLAATPNGANWMFEIVRELRALGYDAYAMISPGQGDLAPKLERAGVPYFVGDVDVANVADLRGIARRVFKLARFLRKHRFDVVHYHLFASVILGRAAAYLADVPVRVSMCTGPYYLEAPATRELDRRTFWMDTKVIPSCEFSRRLYLEIGVPPGKLACIYYGADPAAFDPARADARKIRREYGMADDSPVVTMVSYFYGRLPIGPWTPAHLQNRSVKGHDTFLEAAKLVLQSNPRVRFLLVGRGWEAAGEAYQREMKALAKTLGVEDAVIFTGMRRDIPDVLAGADVAVQCSRSENLGGSIEALLMARPTVASNVGGLVDAVRHEQTGLLTPMDDAPKLAEAILRLLDRPDWAAQLGRNGRELMLRDFTLKKTVADIDRLYLTCAEAVRRGRGRRNRPPSAFFYRPTASLLHAAKMALRLWDCVFLPGIKARMRAAVARLPRARMPNAGLWRAAVARLPRVRMPNMRPWLTRAAPTTQDSHHEAHEGHEEECDSCLKLRALRVLRGGTTRFLLPLSVHKALKASAACVRCLSDLVPLSVGIAAPAVLLRGSARVFFLGAVVLALAYIRFAYRGPTLALIRLLTKRILDVAAAVAAAVATMPAWLAAGWIARNRSKASVLVRLPTVGRFGAVFGRLAFRTEPPALGDTRVARLLRRLGAEAAPALLNVFRGEMSMVGPPPRPPEAAGDPRILAAKPGLIAWADVRGGGGRDERLRRDLWYVERLPFWADVWALLTGCARLLLGRPLRSAGAEAPASNPPSPT